MKTYQLDVLPIVFDDVADLHEHIARDSEDQASRFLEAIEEAQHKLIQWPGPLQKRALRPKHPSQGQVRRWNIGGFPNHTLIYDVSEDVVTVLRCVHSSRITDGFMDDVR